MIRGHKIGFMPAGSYHKKSVEETVRSLADIGYDAVEWSMHDVSPDKHSTDEIRAVFEASEKAGLTVSEICVQRDFLQADDEASERAVALVNRCIEVFSSFGVDTINLFSGPVPWNKNPLVIGRDISEGAAWEKLYRAFDRILPCAERCRMNLALENVWGMLCCDCYSAEHLLRHYDSPNLGVNLDISHDILAGHTDVAWLIRNWAGRIKHVHLKDAVGVQRDGKFLFPLLGEGMIDWKVFIDTIEEVGYTGVLSVEFESYRYVSTLWAGDWEKAARQSLENLKILFA